MLLGGRDLNRRDRLAAHHRVEMAQPFLAIEADVEVDAVERAERADGIRTALQHVRRPPPARALEEVGQRSSLRELVELPVISLPAAQLFLADALAHSQPGAQAVD